MVACHDGIYSRTVGNKWIGNNEHENAVAAVSDSFAGSLPLIWKQAAKALPTVSGSLIMIIHWRIGRQWKNIRRQDCAIKCQRDA